MILVDMESIDLEHEISVLDYVPEANDHWWSRATYKQAQMTQEIYIKMQDYMREHPEYYGCFEK